MKWAEGFRQHTEQRREESGRPAVKEAVGSQSKEIQVFTSLSLTDSRIGIIHYPRHNTFSEDEKIRDGYCSEVAQSVQNLSNLQVAITLREKCPGHLTARCQGHLRLLCAQALGEE